MTTVIEVEDVSKVYRLGETEVHALRGANLTVDEGEMIRLYASHRALDLIRRLLLNLPLDLP